MKVKVEFVVLDSDGKRMKGRQAFVVGKSNNSFSLGTIYNTSADAIDLSEQEIQSFKDMLKLNHNNLEIVEIF